MAIRAPQSPAAVLSNAIAESVALGHAPSRSEGYTKPLLGRLAGIVSSLSANLIPGVGSFARSMAGPDFGGGPAQPQVETSKPLPVYSIPLPRLAKLGRDSLPDAQLHSWRVFAGEGPEGQTIDVADADQKPVSVRRGGYAAMVAKASALADSVTPSQVDYEARLLDFGRLGMSALWLHNDDSDRFFTLEPNPRERSRAELLDVAQQRAQDRLGGASDLGGAAPILGAVQDLGG